MNNKKTVIFDLDGTLAIVDKRRELAMKPNGKMDWDVFFDPKNISLDEPNWPVVKVAKMFDKDKFDVVIFSGRSDRTIDATVYWLNEYHIPFELIAMREKKEHFVPDEILKKEWLDTLVKIDDVFAVFDDRQKVVDMWRENGLTTFQVDKGDF